MWYVIQTMTGQEEELVQIIREVIAPPYYDEVFLIRKETVRKTGEEYKVFLAPLFPGYIFIDTRDPETLFYQLKALPKFTKLLVGDEGVFLEVSKIEKDFLESIQDSTKEHLVSRSYVEVDYEGQIIYAEGAVGKYRNQIVRQRLRKRRVWIEQEFLGQKRRIVLDIKLNRYDENVQEG